MRNDGQYYLGGSYQSEGKQMNYYI